MREPDIYRNPQRRDEFGSPHTPRRFVEDFEMGFAAGTGEVGRTSVNARAVRDDEGKVPLRASVKS
jgi:hypothetical protein